MFANIINKWNYLRNNTSSNDIISDTEHGDNTSKNNNMLSSRVNSIASEDNFITPVSSMGDLMALSPQKPIKSENSDITSDYLTGTEFNSICDVTMQELPIYDDILIDGSSLDYLAACANSHRNQHYVDRAKESLFVKFDPLYANQQLCHKSQQGELPADSLECDIGYETSSTTSAFTDASETPKLTLSTGSVPSKSGKDKPTQVVPPVVTNDLQKGCSEMKSVPALIRSVSAILTPTQVATERLISISDNCTPPIAAPRSPRNKSFSSQEVDRLQSLRIILQNQDQEVLQLRQENRELKSSLQEAQHDNSRFKEEYESRIKRLTEERENLQKRECQLVQQLNDKILSNKQMCIVMEEYEKTISVLISDQQKEKLLLQEAIDNLTAERDEALKHLTSMESSFNDLLAKYEKCKSVLIEAKEREKILEQNINEYKTGLEKYEYAYTNLQKITKEKLDHASETLDKINKNHNIEVTKLNAMIKKHEVSISSLQESLAQKARDNEELTRICDQLINDVR